MGGGGKGGSTQSSGSNYNASTSTTTLPDWVTAGAQQALGQGQQLAAQPYQPYPGNLVAGTTPDTQQAYNQIQQMQGMGMPQYQQDIGAYTGLLGQAAPQTAGGVNQATNQLYGNYAGGVVAPSAGLLSPYMGGPTTAQGVGQNTQALMSPYAQSVIAPTLQLGQQALAQNLQQIGAGANQANAFGGTRQGVMEGVAQSQAALNEQNTLANMLNTGWNQALSSGTNIGLQGGQQGYGAANTLAGLLGSGYGAAQQQAGGISAANQQAGLTAAAQLPSALTSQQQAAANQASLLASSGAAQQQQQQNVLNAAYGQYQQQQAWPYMQLQTLLSTLGSVPYGTTSYNQGYGQGTSTSQNNPSIGSQISQGIGLATSLFSDRRMKTDIKRVGQTDAGTPTYTYRYKGDPLRRVHMGVMAQDLLATKPEAVLATPSGLLGVDYSQVA